MTIEQIQQRLAENEAKQQEIRDELRLLQRDRHALNEDLTRERLKALIGRRVQLTNRGGRFAGRTGELLEVGWTGCVVGFGGKRAHFPIGDVVAAVEPQGTLIGGAA